MLSLESKIVRVISKSTKKCWRKRYPKEWTFCMKKSLVDLGHKHNFKVYAASKRRLKADWEEWLYDLCWSTEGKDWRILKGLKLIAEIEWNIDQDAILSDFQKLTVGVSDLRLMITRYWDSKRGEAHLKMLVELCQKTCPRLRGFRYLFIAIPERHPENIKAFSWVR